MLSKAWSSDLGTVQTKDEDVGPRGSKATGPEGRNLCQVVTLGSSDDIAKVATRPIWWYCQESMSRPSDFLTRDWAPSAPTKNSHSNLFPSSNSIITGELGTWVLLYGDTWKENRWQRFRPVVSSEDQESHSSWPELHIWLPHWHTLEPPSMKGLWIVKYSLWNVHLGESRDSEVIFHNMRQWILLFSTTKRYGSIRAGLPHLKDTQFRYILGLSIQQLG